MNWIQKLFKSRKVDEPINSALNISVVIGSNPIKIGDTIKMSSKNPNHLGFGECAYSGMEGTVVQTWEDGAFCINTGTSELVVPLGKRKGVWIFLNGKHLYHKRLR